MKCRITYEKTGIGRYIGHLDLQRIFQRALRRGGLKPKYSEGFNPHPLISFASPLALGMTGLGELVDVELFDTLDPREILQKLNNGLPQGLGALKCDEISPGEKSAAALLRKAVYLIEFGNLEMSEIVRAVSMFSAQSKEEIKNYVYAIEAKDSASEPPIIEATIACGGKGNLNPKILAETLSELAGVTFDPISTEYTRRELIF